jgi:hypothetical protein
MVKALRRRDYGIIMIKFGLLFGNLELLLDVSI